MDNVHNGFVYYVVSCCSWEIYFKKFCKGVQGKKLFQKFFPCKILKIYRKRPRQKNVGNAGEWKMISDKILL